MPEDIIKPPKQTASSAPPLDSEPASASEDQVTQKISISDGSDDAPSDDNNEKLSPEVQNSSESTDEPETPEDGVQVQPTENTTSEEMPAEDHTQDVPVSSEQAESEPTIDSDPQPADTQWSHVEPSQAETSEEQHHDEAPKHEDHEQLQANVPASAQEHHKAHHKPVLAIVIAIIVCLALIGGAVYMVFGSSDKTEEPSTTVQTQATTEQPAQSNDAQAQVEGAVTEASQLPAPEDPSTGLSDQSIGLQ